MTQSDPFTPLCGEGNGYEPTLRSYFVFNMVDAKETADQIKF